jgi:serine/threonine protein kinase
MSDIPTPPGAPHPADSSSTVPEGPVTLHPGLEVVPGYRLVGFRGAGGFGEVWEASAPGDFPVALKFIRLDHAHTGPELRGLQVLRSVRHPHLLDVQWAVRAAGRLVICMPLCDRSLMGRHEECVARGQPGIPRDELLRYMSEAAAALDFLNEPRHPAPDGGRGSVQHRDIKPHNLFLVGGSVRVADFGLAKIVQETVGEHSGPMTVAYAPPEFFHGQVAPTSDQYSLAVTYTQLRGGRLPFTGTVYEMIHRITHEAPDLGGLPERERPVVARALDKQPAQRWPSCAAFVERLGGGTAGAPRTASLRALADEVRERTLQVLGATQRKHLTWAPAGTSNHILWHAGHALWVQDALCIQVATGKSELPPGWEELFRMGSRPAQQRKPWPTRDELHRALKAQLSRLHAVIGAFRETDLDALPPFPHRGDDRTLERLVLHGLHDEACHHGEMYLLHKMQTLGGAGSE